MFVSQLAVFLENREGRMSEFCNVLAKANIDIVTMSIADTNEFGILRAITRDNAKALLALKEAGFTAKCTDLIGISVKDEAGALAKVLTCLRDDNISIEYLYSYVRREGDSAIILIKANDPNKAIEVLKKTGATFVENKIL